MEEVRGTPTAKPKDDAWISVFTSLELKRKFRVRCADEGVSMSAKLVELIENYVDPPARAGRKR